MPRVEIKRRKIKHPHSASLSKDEEKAVELAFSALSCIGGSAERRLTAARNFNKTHILYDVTTLSVSNIYCKNICVHLHRNIFQK